MFLLTLGRDPIEGLFFTKDLKIQFGPPADLAAAHKWWCLSDWHHTSLRDSARHTVLTWGGQPNKVTWHVAKCTYPNLAGNTNQENKCPGPGQALSLGFLNSQARLRLTPGPPLSRAELGSNGPGLSGPWVWGPTQHITMPKRIQPRHQHVRHSQTYLAALLNKICLPSASAQLDGA